MLAAPLLRVTTRNGMIMPLFCTRNDELELAQRVLEEFQESHKARERKHELYGRISAIESSHNVDYKLVRGLCALLERRCVFNVHSSAGSDAIARSSSPHLLPASSGATATASSIDPIDVRRMLFEESSKRGFALTDLERDDIINSISEKLHVSPDDIKKAMWSDLDDNLVLEHFEHIDAKTLVGWYNLSLMQTLLFNATKMEFSISGGSNWKRVLRNVKRLGLMYYLENRDSQQQQQQQYHQHHKGGDKIDNGIAGNNSSLVCSLEGPLSLFKLTDRYGTSLAKLLPSIVLSKEPVDWQIDAWILRKTMMTTTTAAMQGKKLYQFKMSNREILPFLADPFYHIGKYAEDSNEKRKATASAEHYYSFDSLVEEKFARKFNEVVGEASGWKLVREPDPLIVDGGKAFIPDFMFEKYGNRVYLEIVGFWTPEYLERKLHKVKQIMKADNDNNNNGHYYKSKEEGSSSGVVDMFIAISEELAGSRISSSSSSSSSPPATFSSSVPADKLIFYKNDSVPITPILDHLKALDKEMIERKAKDSDLRIEFDHSKDVISLKDLAQKYDLPIEVVSRIASRDHGDQYIGIGGERQQQQHQQHYLISKVKAKKMESLLKEKGIKRFTDACTILSENAIPEACHAEFIEKLGYEVIWRSMDIDTAVIEKRRVVSA